MTIEIDIDKKGNVTITPNPAVVSDGDTVRWHVDSNETGAGSLTVSLPAGRNSPFGNTDSLLGSGVEQPRHCNLLEPSTNPLRWPAGVESYGYEVSFRNSPVKTVQAVLQRGQASCVDVTALADQLAGLLGGPAALWLAAKATREAPGVATITGDDCTRLTFTIHGKTVVFRKAGHASWVETVKYSHRHKTNISVTHQPSGRDNVAIDIHDA